MSRLDPDPIRIATVQKNASETVVISLSHFRGIDLADVRTFYTDAKGENRATPKGVAVNITKLPELRAALQAAEAEAIRRGLLNDGGRA